MKKSCSVLSFRDQLRVSFGSVVEDRELERRFYLASRRPGRRRGGRGALEMSICGNCGVEVEEGLTACALVARRWGPLRRRSSGRPRRRLLPRRRPGRGAAPCSAGCSRPLRCWRARERSSSSPPTLPTTWSSRGRSTPSRRSGSSGYRRSRGFSCTTGPRPGSPARRPRFSLSCMGSTRLRATRGVVRLPRPSVRSPRRRARGRGSCGEPRTPASAAARDGARAPRRGPVPGRARADPQPPRFARALAGVVAGRAGVHPSGGAGAAVPASLAQAAPGGAQAVPSVGRACAAHRGGLLLIRSS